MPPRYASRYDPPSVEYPDSCSTRVVEAVSGSRPPFTAGFSPRKKRAPTDLPIHSYNYIEYTYWHAIKWRVIVQILDLDARMTAVTHRRHKAMRDQTEPL